jgi:hypothetical protein
MDTTPQFCRRFTLFSERKNGQHKLAVRFDQRSPQKAQNSKDLILFKFADLLQARHPAAPGLQNLRVCAEYLVFEISIRGQDRRP